jgi:hypothetical protein
VDPRTEQRLGSLVGFVGLVVAVVGLAGPLPANTPLAAALMVGGAIAAGVGLYLYMRVRSLPPFSIERQHNKFKITKPDGSECICEKEVEFRCNLRDQRDFFHRNLYADGGLGDFAWEGDGVAGPCENRAGEFIVPIRREPSWPIGKTQRGTLSCKVKGTFSASTEWVAYVCDRETDTAEITVYFPAERSFKKAWATDRRAGQDIHRDSSALDQRANQLHRAVKNPKLGCEYYIYWEW